jgi:hypothetical protein
LEHTKNQVWIRKADSELFFPREIISWKLLLAKSPSTRAGFSENGSQRDEV